MTEKFWRRMDQGLVPIAMGRENYSAIAPPHSLIDVGDFASPGDLARFLTNLTANEYLSYFWWVEQLINLSLLGLANCIDFGHLFSSGGGSTTR